MTDSPNLVSKAEFQQLATGVRSVTVIFSLALAAYNALITFRLFQMGDTFYGRMALAAENKPWVFTYSGVLLACSAILPVVAGILGLRLKNHLHALTGVMICLLLMLLQMHLVGSAIVSPLLDLLNGMSKAVLY